MLFEKICNLANYSIFIVLKHKFLEVKHINIVKVMYSHFFSFIYQKIIMFYFLFNFCYRKFYLCNQIFHVYNCSFYACNCSFYPCNCLFLICNQLLHTDNQAFCL